MQRNRFLGDLLTQLFDRYRTAGNDKVLDFFLCLNRLLETKCREKSA